MHDASLIVALCVILSAVVACCNATKSMAGKSHVKILYGSCHSTRLRSPLWPHIVGRDPDLWIWGGDNMYADKLRNDPLHALMHFQLPFEKANETALRESYKELNADPGYKSLIETGVERIAIWDDHDYGINDGDKTYPLKEVSRKVFLEEFEQAAPNDPRWTQKGGIYQAKTFQVQDGSFRVIALDVRFSKDPWSVKAETGDMLGHEQWAWLEKELCDNRAPRVNIFLSGLQVLPTQRGAGEAWIKFPSSRQRLFSLLAKCKVQAPLFMSGDVHMAEFFEAKCGKLPAKDLDERESNVIAEITSSGMTHSWGTRSPGWIGEIVFMNWFLSSLMNVCQLVMPWNYRSIRAKGALPEGAFYLGLNFAQVEINFEKDTIYAEAIRSDNLPALGQEWTFEELDVKFQGDPNDYKCEPLRGEGSYVQLIFARIFVVTVFFFVLPVFVITSPYVIYRKIVG